MLSLIYLLAQVQQPPRSSWTFLLLFGLLAVVAIGLLVYLLTRVRKSEKEAEEDWGLASRGILLPVSPPSRTPSKITEAPAERAREPQAPEPPPAAPSQPSSPEPAVETIAAPEPEPVAQTARPVQQIETPVVVPSPVESYSASSQQAPVAEVEKQSAPAPDQPAPAFDEEIWSELETRQPAHGQSGSSVPAAAFGEQREPYEPPRIDPITPLKESNREQSVPVTGRPASAAQQAPASRARLEAPAPPRTPAPSRKPEPAVAGSVLGLPAETSHGPLVIDRSRGLEYAAGVGTLANYDKPPDDAAGHSGTIALVAVLILVCGSIGAYLALPPVHSRVDNWVARARGVDTSEPPKPVAQVFPAALDGTSDPAHAKGTLQNISDQTLSGLTVVIALDPRGGGDALTQEFRVNPDEIAPGQQGTYEFQIETKKYKSYKIVSLKNRDGASLGFVKPNQQQQ